MVGAAPTDVELIERVAARDGDAFAELHRRYIRATLGLALRALGDREDAERAADSVWAALWASAPGFDRSQDDPERWVYAVARTHLTGTPNEVEGAAGWASWRAHRALATLPGPERDVVELAYWGGMSTSEIAAFLHATPETVTSLSRSALGRIADGLGPDGSP